MHMPIRQLDYRGRRKVSALTAAPPSMHMYWPFSNALLWWTKVCAGTSQLQHSSRPGQQRPGRGRRAQGLLSKERIACTRAGSQRQPGHSCCPACG